MEYITATKAAENWGVSITAVCYAAKAGRIPGAEFSGGRWHIPENVKNPMKKAIAPLPGYISVKEAAEKWFLDYLYVCRIVKEGRIPGAVHTGGRWHVPEDAVYPIDRRRKQE